MMSPAIQDAVSRATDTEHVAIGRGILPQAGRHIAAQLGAGPFLIVADDNTWSVAGPALAESFKAMGCPMVEPLVLSGDPAVYASYENCLTIQAHMGECTAVALGAGTINDLVKLASKEMGRRYAVVGTAASMDGYAGFGAPMTENGVKVTRACPAPAVAILDLDLVAQAPTSMTASGYGDLAAKIPGGADWILADAAGVEPINAEVWAMVQSGVSAALSQPEVLAAGHPDAFEGLVEGLVLSGLAMQAYGGTRPASGAEHYFSHLWELERLGADQDPPLSHGFKVAIGSLAMCAFYEALLARDLSTLNLAEIVSQRAQWQDIERDIRATFDGALADNAVRETKAKYVAGDELIDRLKPIVSGWPDISATLLDQLIPARDLSRMLQAAGAPSRPEDIGLSASKVRDTFPRAMYYRSRYTALDVAWELGIFDELVDEAFTRLWN